MCAPLGLHASLPVCLLAVSGQGFKKEQGAHTNDGYSAAGTRATDEGSHRHRECRAHRFPRLKDACGPNLNPRILRNPLAVETYGVYENRGYLIGVTIIREPYYLG